MIVKRIRAALLAGLLGLAACGTGSATPPSPPPNSAVPPTGSPATSPPADPKSVAANELGDVPVLMYHRITEHPASVYDRTPGDFRAELERLAQQRYVPVTTAAYAAGELDIPAGTHPVVLTFDDGDPSQFRLTPQGDPAAGTAVAIMREVAARYPRFRAVASFYVNGNPFGDPGGAKTLPWLRDHGMEIGNHTLTHANLRQAGAAGAQREIARGDQAIRQAVPGVEPVTFALPFGIHPGDPALALTGTADGFAYHYRGVLLVGANPAPSPYSTRFDPLRIPRIRSQGDSGKEASFGSTAWLTKLAASGTWYTSDGVPGRIAYPRAAARPIAPAFQARAMPY